MSPFRSRKGGILDGKHIQPIEEIPSGTSTKLHAAFKSRFVAATTRTSTWDMLPSPTRSNSRS